MKTFKKIEAPDLENQINLADDNSLTEVGGLICSVGVIVGIIIDNL